MLICFQLVEHRSDTHRHRRCLPCKQPADQVCLCATSLKEVHFCILIFKESLRSAQHQSGAEGVCVYFNAQEDALQLSWLILPHSTSNHGKECRSSCLCVRGVAASLCGASSHGAPCLQGVTFPDHCVGTVMGKDCKQTGAGVTSFAGGGSQHSAVLAFDIHHWAREKTQFM